MNKTDLVNEIAAKANLSKVAAKVHLLGFGTLQFIDKEARIGITPRTTEKIEIPARKVVKFKPAAELGK